LQSPQIKGTVLAVVKKGARSVVEETTPATYRFVPLVAREVMPPYPERL
jgi:hypothetical protein